MEWLSRGCSGASWFSRLSGPLADHQWRTPKLTVIGAVVLTWGMTGQLFVRLRPTPAQVVAADVFGSVEAERLIADGYLHDPGMIVGVPLVPVIAGMLFGVILLAVALWRSGFPPVPGRHARALAAWGLLRALIGRSVHHRALPPGRWCLARGRGGAAAARPLARTRHLVPRTGDTGGRAGRHPLGRRDLPTAVRGSGCVGRGQPAPKPRRVADAVRRRVFCRERSGTPNGSRPVTPPRPRSWAWWALRGSAGPGSRHPPAGPAAAGRSFAIRWVAARGGPRHQPFSSSSSRSGHWSGDR